MCKVWHREVHGEEVAKEGCTTKSHGILEAMQRVRTYQVHNEALEASMHHEVLADVYRHMVEELRPWPDLKSHQGQKCSPLQPT